MEYRYFNPNPCGRIVGDCAVRAIAKALNMDWGQAYSILASFAYNMCDMPNANSVGGAELKSKGFEREIIPNTCPDCYTISDFANDHQSGTFVLGTGTHVVTVIDGNIYDSWDSSRELPQYFWRR